jgi:hypothetical protein
MRQEGWKIFFVPAARIYHGQGKSVGDGVDARILYYRSRYIYFKKWHPGSFRLFYTLVFVRLMINTVLSLAGTLLTIGIHRGLRKKTKVYIQLLFWHLKGCS